MKLASEKNLNRYCFPITAKKRTPLPHNKVFQQGEFKFLCEAGTFGPKEMMILDVIATLMLHSAYNYPIKGKIDLNDRIPTMNDRRVQNYTKGYMSKSLLNFMVSNIYKRGEDKIPENYYTDEKLSSIDSNYGRIKEIRGMPINDATLKKMVPILKKYSSNQIYKMIQRTAECKIKIFYPIRCFDDGSYTNIKNEIYSFSSSFFRLTEVKPIKYSKDKKILARSYTLIFDNILSYFYVHNVLACYIDILPGRFYSLSDNAQLFYRLLVLPYFKQVKNPIGLKEIKNRLVLKTSNTTMVRKTIKRIMDELDANSFIKAPKEIKKEGEYYYEYVKLKWDEIKK